MNNRGKTGCGCLLVILVAAMVAVGLFIHPMTLKFVGSQFTYADKLFPSDALFIPRFPEDVKGEIYIEAFREYQSGTGKTILLENDTMLGLSIADLVGRMAKNRGIKEGTIRTIELSGDDLTRTEKMAAAFQAMKLSKVVIIVPEYASKRYHLLLETTKRPGSVIILVHAVPTSYFKKDQWWKDRTSRSILIREAMNTGTLYLERFKHGKWTN